MSNKEDKKAARRLYKEATRAAGIYRIVNTHDGRYYVDSTPDLRARQNRFQMEFRSGGLRQPTALVRDLELLGAEAFEFEVLEELEQDSAPDYDPADDLKTLLELWLEKLEPWGERGYNKAPAPRS